MKLIACLKVETDPLSLTQSALNYLTFFLLCKILPVTIMNVLLYDIC